MKTKIASFAAIVILSLTGCASSKVSTIPVSMGTMHSVSAIAIGPGGGLVADAVAVELSNRGFNVIDSASVSSMMVRLNLNEIEISTPEGLAKLKDQGIDAFLTVRAAGGDDMQPQSASARVNSTHNGKVMAGVTWQNGWGCVEGSPCDRTMRKGLVEAAAEIADTITKSIKAGN